MSIPKILHQIWIGPNPIPEREQGFRQRVQEIHPSYTHRLWTDIDIADLYMPDPMQKAYDKQYAEGKYALACDVLRIWVVYKFGGIYCDIDFSCLQPLDHFLQFDGVLLYHHHQADDFTVVNGWFAFEKEHPIMKHLVDAFEDGKVWWAGPSWFGEEVKKFFNLPYEAEQSIVKQRLFGFGVEYFGWKEFEEQFMKHFALYSWR